MQTFTRKVLGAVTLCALLSMSAAGASAAVSRTFTWNAVVTNADGTPAEVLGYTMYRSSDNGITFIKQVPNTGSAVLTWTDPAVPAGTICYEVTALNAAGESARSNRVCFSVPSAVPNPPTSLSVSGGVPALKVE